MSIRNFKYLFKPRSITVIGASNRPRRVGSVVMQNLLKGGFQGPIMPVNPKYQAVCGVLAYPNVEALPMNPDLAILCTPPHTIPRLLQELGERGVRAAVILTAGMRPEPSAGEHANDVNEWTGMLETARHFGMRLLGPNTIGLLIPSMHLNASFAHMEADPGSLAFISQSGALCTAILDWARSQGIGFSHFLSLGDSADIDVGDVLDYLGSDPNTRAILMYIESITQARKFMSAARAAARNKPVLAIKAGRQAEGAKAASSHTGALIGRDEVYDAAFSRAGVLRVFEIDELFDAVETLERTRPLQGNRLAIVTNGGGPGVLAADVFAGGGGTLAQLSDTTLQELSTLLPSSWSRGNPIDIVGDAGGERYAQALTRIINDPDVHAVVVTHAPTAVVTGEEAAQAVVNVIRTSASQKNVFTSWLGGQTARSARQLFAEAHIPTYDTPEKAVRAFLHLMEYSQRQETLMEIPPSIPREFQPVSSSARFVIEQALAQGRSLLNEPEAKAILAAYGIPIVETHIASTTEQAIRFAEQVGFPVALKILSPDIIHKTDVGGVVLDVESPKAVEAAFQGMRDRLQQIHPGAEMRGVTVQPMARRPGAYELLVGATVDAAFGPIIVFGQGGIAVELLGDHAMALPPLNMKLAKDLIHSTKIVSLLQGFRTHPGVDLEAICLTLIQISHLVQDFPEIVELDINPLLADQKGVLALDARITIAPSHISGPQHLAIRPYPQELEEWITLRSGEQVFCRPIRPEDEPAHHEFFARLSPEDIRFRFFGLIQELPHSQMARFTQIDYDREMAFIAIRTSKGERAETLGVVRTINDANNQTAEFAIVVRSDMKGQGVGRQLLEKMIRYCRKRGTERLVGQVLTDNTGMLELARRTGFTKKLTAEGDAMEITLSLTSR
ncbi:MAG TPA: bifunctional acetate--CoA ligase family protein/GNAT family N-acetyltransferase [Nitrospirales bacterium]|nr:bifunctional acetate--CoA ligase family protein/GNAT family N-acetyltransferase [Nitrospirales bacterium]